MKTFRNLVTLILLVWALVDFQADLYGQTFLIEAEDFDFDSGQHIPAADVMPYFGGGYDGHGSAAEVDYHVEFFQDSPDLYRFGETPNVPMSETSAFPESLRRGEWDVTVNYRLGWLFNDQNNWFNYTRSFPPGRYRVYAGLTWGDFSTGVLRGELSRVTGGAGTANQSVELLGAFRGDGLGNWLTVQRVPLMQGGSNVVVELGGPATLRFTGRSGDFDYLLLVPESVPATTITPHYSEIVANSSFSLTANAVGDGPLTYQWRFNGTDIPGATGAQLNLAHVTAADSGRYSVRVGNSAGSFESEYAVLRVYYPIHIGDTVAPNIPLPGAGILAGTGTAEEHTYRFSGTAGQAVFFEELDGDDCSGLWWQVRAPSGRFVFAAPLGIYCYPDPVGTHLLPETGEYQLTVSNPGFAAGSYSFRLVEPAHIETFHIALGDTVDINYPGGGSGSTAGYDNVDIFSFEVTQPTAVYFRVFYGTGCDGGFQTPGQQWALFDPAGGLVFVEPLAPGCPEYLLDTHLLDKVGTYRLVVVPGSIPIIYSFQLAPTIIQTHNIAIGDRVSPDHPDPGAGLTQILGELDIYLFQGTAGQVVFLHDLPDLSQCIGAKLQMESPHGKLIYFEWIDDNCSGGEGPALLTLPESGTYKITVWAGDSTGTHSFELLPSVGVQEFTLSLGDSVKQNHPAAGAGYLDSNGASDEFTLSLDADSQVAFLDLGSDGNALIWTVSQVAPPFNPQVLSAPLDGVGEGTFFLSRGQYRIRVSAPSANPTASGKYRFQIRLNGAPVAADDRLTVPAGTATEIPKSRLLANDHDPDGDPLYFYYFLGSASGAQIRDSGNSLIYTPPAGFTGVDTFTYFVFDTGWLVSNGAAVSVSVR